MSALSPRVAFLDHQRLLLNVDNSAIKQRIAALAQDKIFKDGTYYSIILLFLQPYIFTISFHILIYYYTNNYGLYIYICAVKSCVYIYYYLQLATCHFFSCLFFIPHVATWFFLHNIPVYPISFCFRAFVFLVSKLTIYLTIQWMQSNYLNGFTFN